MHRGLPIRVHRSRGDGWPLAVSRAVGRLASTLSTSRELVPRSVVSHWTLPTTSPCDEQDRTLGLDLTCHAAPFPLPSTTWSMCRGRRAEQAKEANRGPTVGHPGLTY